MMPVLLFAHAHPEQALGGPGDGSRAYPEQALGGPGGAADTHDRSL